MPALTNVEILLMFSAMGQDELIAMIAHGAEKILSGESQTQIPEESIEEIIRKGEEKTKELTEKYANIGMEDLQKFSMDQISAYQWEGEDYKTKSKLFGLIRNKEPSKRERRVNYALFPPKPMKTAPAKAPRPPKQTQM